MKKNYFLSILTVLFAFSAKATIHNVAVMNSSFNPTVVTALCGDTVRWTLQSNFSHTTTSTTIPVGATSWNAPINSTSMTFSYVVTVQGTYNYVCTPHGFTGSIIVTCPSNVNQLSTPKFNGLFPNPCRDYITVQFNAIDFVSVTNVIGEEMVSFKIGTNSTELSINMSDFPKGMYFIRLTKEGNIVTTRKFTKVD